MHTRNDLIKVGIDIARELGLIGGLKVEVDSLDQLAMVMKKYYCANWGNDKVNPRNADFSLSKGNLSFTYDVKGGKIEVNLYDHSPADDNNDAVHLNYTGYGFLYIGWYFKDGDTHGWEHITDHRPGRFQNNTKREACAGVRRIIKSSSILLNLYKQAASDNDDIAGLKKFLRM